MNIKILEEIGLTKTEIKIYLTLLKLGQSTTTNIVRKAEIHASKVYEFLDKLIQKGLVSYVIKSNKKYFSASEPDFLKEFLREKENKIKEQESEINKILPELKENKGALLRIEIADLSSQKEDTLREFAIRSSNCAVGCRANPSLCLVTTIAF